MHYQTIRTSEEQFKAVTSLTVAEFDELLAMFASKWEDYISRYKLDGKPRTRKYSPKASEGLVSVAQKLFFILSCQKNNPLQEYHAASFRLSQDMCNKWIHVLSPLLDESLDAYKASREAESLQDKPGLGNTYLSDATERAVEKDTYKQESYYSGKKKMHTVKNLLLTALTGFVVFLSATVCGKVHGKAIADERLYFTKPVHLLADLGFYGYKPEAVRVEMPPKKPRNGELTKIQKAQDKLLARRRISIEHVIARVKTMRIVKDRIRSSKEGYRDLVVNTAVALHNFRITKRRTILLPQTFCS